MWELLPENKNRPCQYRMYGKKFQNNLYVTIAIDCFSRLFDKVYGDITISIYVKEVGHRHIGACHYPFESPVDNNNYIEEDVINSILAHGSAVADDILTNNAYISKFGE